MLHKTLFSQIGAIRLALATQLQIQLSYMPITHPLMPWVVEHATWLLNRYLIHDDGILFYQRRFKQQSLIGIVEFGEVVYFKAHGEHDTPYVDLLFAKLYVDRKRVRQQRTSDSMCTRSCEIKNNQTGSYCRKVERRSFQLRHWVSMKSQKRWIV
jgi:hypothetical protein